MHPIPKGTVYGKVIYQDKEYESLSMIFDDKTKETIKSFIKEFYIKCRVAIALWHTNYFIWEIIDNQIFLIDIRLKNCLNVKNLIEDIFDVKKLFIPLIDKDIKLLISKKEQNSKTKAKVLKLIFENSTLQSQEVLFEEYNSMNLKKYVES